MARPARNASGGFTLIEVVVALLIVAMMLTSLTKLLTLVRSKRDTIHNIQENQLVGPAILDLIHRDLRAVLTTNRSRDSYMQIKNRVVLGQDADSIDFVTTTDNVVWTYDGDRSMRADYGEVGYRLRPSPTSDDFLEMYRREGFGIDDEPFSGGTFTFLHDQIRNFNITVFSEDGPDAEPFEEWGMDPADIELQGLPAWIEISLTLELSPRLKAEALPIALVDRGTVTYKRIVRLPEQLRVDQEGVPWLGVPSVPAEEAEPTAAGDEENPDEDGGGGDGGIPDGDDPLPPDGDPGAGGDS